MKQGRDLRKISSTDEDAHRSRLWRWLGRLLTVIVILGAGWLSRMNGWVSSSWGAALVMAGLLVMIMGWTKWSDRRRQRRWRRDGILFEPELPRPISSIPEVSEWRFPSHPWVRGPLAILLVGLLYWVWVVHGMQLPGTWLVATVVLALVNLWVWSEPLLLVFIVAMGVAMLALTGWVINTLPLMGKIAAALSLVAVIVLLWAQVRKRQSKGNTGP